PDGAYHELARLLESETAAGSRALRAAVALEAGITSTARGEPAIAERHLRHALAEFEAADDTRGRATTARHLGGSARYRGDLRQAVMWLDSAVSLAREVGDAAAECAALIDLAS